MKKLLILLVLLSLVCTQFAVTITTATGEKIKGDITKKVNDRYHLKTNTGERVVFQSEITKVLSDSGYDVTQSILDMPSITEETNLLQSGEMPAVTDINKMTDREFSIYLQKMQYNSQKKIWMLSTGTTIAVCGFAYILFNNSKNKKPWNKH